MRAREEQYKAELEWIDSHLFQDVDTKATRDFIKNPESIEAKRLLRICELIDKEAEVGRLREALERIQTWANAYPLDVFQKPDLKKAHEVLKAAGMTLDAISADVMRHVLDGVKDIVDEALSLGGDKDGGGTDASRRH